MGETVLGFVETLVEDCFDFPSLLFSSLKLVFLGVATALRLPLGVRIGIRDLESVRCILLPFVVFFGTDRLTLLPVTGLKLLRLCRAPLIAGGLSDMDCLRPVATCWMFCLPAPTGETLAARCSER